MQAAGSMPCLDALPDDLLQRVLSMVPLEWPQPAGPAASKKAAGGLLSLRLVCRRWAAAVLSMGVWRRRELNLRGHAGLLRLVRGVGRLYLSFNKHGDDNKSYLLDLAALSCQVRVHACRLSFDEALGLNASNLPLLVVRA